MNKYKHLFFDLDGTVWDFKHNSQEVFKEIFSKPELHIVLEDFEKFKRAYQLHCDKLWARYRDGKIEKHELRFQRFYLTIREFGLSGRSLAQKIDNEYIRLSPTKTRLIPHTIEVLEYLSSKYRLYILTNGFNEVQFPKLDNSKLSKYFTGVITSETVGYLKPRPEIFNYALHLTKARKSESLMIGDDLEVDIIGAMNYGIDQVYLNLSAATSPKVSTYEINSLLELKGIL